MYNDELNEALESTYDDGYVQALIDMGIDPDEIAAEDVDMNDDYDEAMEGPAREYRHRNNIGKSQTYISGERFDNRDGATKPKAKPRKTFENMPDGREKNDARRRYEKKIRKYDESVRNFDTIEGRNIRDRTNDKMIDRLRPKMGTVLAANKVYAARRKQYGIQDY